LLFVPYDNSEMYPFADQKAGDTLWELGLDFTVSPGKQDFRGATEHYRLQNQERFKIFGVLLDADVAAEPGDTLWQDGQYVGVITCPMYSRLTKRSLAIARMNKSVAVHGSPLRVKGSLEVGAIAHDMPFDDPEKKKRIAKG
jgi:aminomethyltransferase